jgi:hypothetical protein
MPIAVGAKRSSLKIRKTVERVRVGLYAGRYEVAGSGALDHELEHDNSSVSRTSLRTQ